MNLIVKYYVWLPHLTGDFNVERSLCFKHATFLATQEQNIETKIVSQSEGEENFCYLCHIKQCKSLAFMCDKCK